MNYLIILELKEPWYRYPDLRERLRVDKAKHVLESAWILDYPEHGPEEVLGLIQRTVGSEDGVLVVRMATGNYLGNNLLTEIEKP